MVVTVISVGMVQVAIYKVAGVIAMRYGFMTTPRAVDMVFCVGGTDMVRCAICGVHC